MQDSYVIRKWGDRATMNCAVEGDSETGRW